MIHTYRNHLSLSSNFSSSFTLLILERSTIWHFPSSCNLVIRRFVPKMKRSESSFYKFFIESSKFTVIFEVKNFSCNDSINPLFSREPGQLSIRFIRCSNDRVTLFFAHIFDSLRNRWRNSYRLDEIIPRAFAIFQRCNRFLSVFFSSSSSLIVCCFFRRKFFAVEDANRRDVVFFEKFEAFQTECGDFLSFIGLEKKGDSTTF